MSFTKVFGGADPLPQIITVNAVGTGFNFAAVPSTSTGGAWLTGGSCGFCATPTAISVAATPSVALAVGSYSGQISVTSQNLAANIIIPITLTIVPAGNAAFDNLPGATTFFMRTAGTNPPSQTLRIRNVGSGSLNWTLTRTTADGGNWLSVSATSGTAPSAVAVSVNKSNLPGGGAVAGVFIGHLNFQAASGNFSVPVSFTVGDNVFRQVNGLEFTREFALANPLPQTVTLASTGSAFNFGVLASNANGGNWLAIAPCGFCALPQAIGASVVAPPTLPAGTYTSQIVATSQSGAQVMVIPVTITVTAPGSNYFATTTGQLSYSLKTGGAAITDQIVQIGNGGTGNLNWTAASNTSDGGAWLSVNPPAGTAPSLMTVSISAANLPGGGLTAGTFIGLVQLEATGSRVTIPVAVAVGDNVLTQIHGLNFTKPFAGANPLPQTLTFASTGAVFNFGTTSFSSNGGSWLTVDNCGFCALPQTIRVRITAAPDLAPGTYTGQVIAASQSGGQSVTVPVSLTVTPAGTPFFDSLPGQMNFTVRTDGGTPPPQTLDVRNGGAGTLDWTMSSSTSDGGNWITLSAASGTAPSRPSISIVKTNLPGGGLVAGSFVGEIVLRSASGSVTIPVNVVVSNATFRQVNPLIFTKVFGGADPLPQTILFSSTGTAFNYSSESFTATGGNWLTVDNCGFCALPRATRVSVTAPPDLPAGTYTGEIIATAQSGGASITVPITLIVAPAGSAYLDNLQGHASFAMRVNGTTPPPHTLGIRNAGAGALDWTATSSTADGGNWISLSQAAGTAPSSPTVSIIKANLPGAGLVAGVFTGEVVIRTAASAFTVPVAAFVNDATFRQVNGLRFSKLVAGANPLPQVLTLSSTGTAFNFSSASFSARGGSWLTVDNCGFCALPWVTTVSITADPNLAAGTYTGQIIVTSQNEQSTITIPVTLTVASPAGASFDDVQGQASFNMTPGGAAPPTQELDIRNAGAGTLDWTATTSTADGGAWITLSAPSGTAPQRINIGITPANLPGLGLVAGVFTGQVVLQSAGGSVTIPVAAYVAASVFANRPAMDFAKNAGGANPLPQTLNLASQGANFNFEATPYSGKGGTWLAGACGFCALPNALQVSVNANAALAAGSYLGQIVSFSQNRQIALTVPVRLGITGSNPSPDTVTGLTVSPQPTAAFGQQVTLTAAVNPASGQPPSPITGQVRFFDNGVQIGIATLTAGSAQLVLVSLAPGAHSFTANFLGNSPYLASTSSAQALTVTAGNIAVNSGNGQSAIIGDTYTNPLRVLITTQNGSPVSGVTVIFTAPLSGAGGTFQPSGLTTAQVLTNGSGLATSPALRANATAGSFQVSASTGGVAGTAVFGLTNTLAVGTTLTVAGGSPQSAQTGTAFPLRLRVRVVDGQGRSGTGPIVTFTAPGAGASGAFPGGAASAQAAVDSQGFAEAPVFTANQVAGSYSVTASAPGLAGAAFSLTNTTTPGITIASPAEGQSIGVSAVTVTWTQVAGAAGYRLVVISLFGQAVFTGQIAGAANTSSVLDLPQGTFSVSIHACSDAALTICGGAFAGRNFTVALSAPNAPAITFPQNGSVLDSSTHNLVWNRVTGASRYQVTLRNNTTGTIDLSIGTLDPAVNTIFTMRSGQYTLEVQACAAACSAPTSVNFRVQLPDVPSSAPVISNCSVAAGNILTCTWSNVTRADLYVVQVIQGGAGPGGGALTVASRQVSQTTATFPVPNGNMSVLAAACNGDGCGPYSSAFSISPNTGNPALPNLGSPIGGLTVDGPTIVFSWNRIPGDNGSNTTYRLYVQDFARNQPALDILTTQNFWGAAFAAGRRYDALVIANPGNSPVQGPAQGFITRGNSPLSPTLVAPQHQGTATQGNVRLGWTPIPNGQLYQYYVARQGAASAVASGVTTGIDVQVPLSTLNNQPTTHTGIVRVCNSGLNCSADSEVGWGIWSNQSGGTGVTNFTLIP